MDANDVSSIMFFESSLETECYKIKLVTVTIICMH